MRARNYTDTNLDVHVDRYLDTKVNHYHSATVTKIPTHKIFASKFPASA